VIISRVLIRFYKSFNFDYLRQTDARYKAAPWDRTPGGFDYPFVDVPLESSITAIVGANESGKTQLLRAIKHALTGEHIAPEDFCRYSEFFVVNDAMALPDFGLELTSLSPEDIAVLQTASGTDQVSDETASFRYFRFGDGRTAIYWPTSSGWIGTEDTDLTGLESRFPQPFEINSSVPLPDDVPLEFLADPAAGEQISSRSQRQRLERAIVNLAPTMLDQLQGPKKNAVEIIREALGIRDEPAEVSAEELAQRRLADDLLSKVTGLPRSTFRELLRSIDQRKDGHTQAILARINRDLENALNLQRYWTQDKNFRVVVGLSGRDLTFTIVDRTDTEYLFDERSQGLKYFMSYFVQYLAHDHPAGQSEILLMDEPDAYLSSQAQQDLLRILHEFAHPLDPSTPPVQVAYVTHSPFLLDKNHSERIRVIERGDGEEGARVVRNVSKNHYEPLRSALGNFVAETTFIGTCNLMVEGAADQVLLAAVSTWLRGQGVDGPETLDLNTVTLVPAGSASHVPYMTYLARGLDEERPAVVVLLDSDKPGDDAKELLLKKLPGIPRLINPAFILQVGDVIEDSHDSIEMEDLVPMEILLAGATEYAGVYLEQSDVDAIGELTPSDVAQGEVESAFDALERAGQAACGGALHLDKVGLARSIANVLNGSVRRPTVISGDGEAALKRNFMRLFAAINDRQRRAITEESESRNRAVLKRYTKRFVDNYSKGSPPRHVAKRLLDTIEDALDSTVTPDHLWLELRRLRADHKLDEDLSLPIPDLEELIHSIKALPYLERRSVQVGESLGGP
jgi:hypothetical protein